MKNILLPSLMYILLSTQVNSQDCSKYENLYNNRKFSKLINSAKEDYNVDNKNMCALNYLMLSLYASNKLEDLKSICNKTIEDEISGKIQFSPEVYNTISSFFEIKSHDALIDRETDKYYPYAYLFPLFDNFIMTRRMPDAVAEKLFLLLPKNDVLSNPINQSKIAMQYIESFGFKKGMNIEICNYILQNHKIYYYLPSLFTEYLNTKNPDATMLEDFYTYLNTYFPNNFNELKSELSEAYIKKQGINKLTNSDILKKLYTTKNLDKFIEANYNLAIYEKKKLEELFYTLKNTSVLSEKESENLSNQKGYQILYRIASIYLEKYGFDSEVSIDMMDYINRFLPKVYPDDRNYQKWLNAFDIYLIQENKSANNDINKKINNGKIDYKRHNFFLYRETKLENEYEDFKKNKNKYTDTELMKLLEAFNKDLCLIRSSIVLFELIKKSPDNIKFKTNFIDNLTSLPNQLYFSFRKYYKSDYDQVCALIENNDSLVYKYNKTLYDRGYYEEAFQNLTKSVKSPATKLLTLNCIVKYKGINDCIDYLISLNPGTIAAEKTLNEINNNFKSKELIAATKHLYNNYKKALDSIDITILSNFDLNEIDFNDFKWITKIYKEFRKMDKLNDLEYKYWSAKSPNVSDIDKAVANKDLNPLIASYLLHDYGEACIEEAFHGGGSGVDRETGRNVCVKWLLKASAYNPKDGYIYKSLGDAWSYIGDTNKGQYYYSMAAKLGANMRDRELPGRRKGRIKKDGTLDRRYN